MEPDLTGPNFLSTKFENDIARQEATESTRRDAVRHGAPGSSWLRFAVPSVADLVFVLLLVALSWGTLSKALLGDAGIGWHIRTGELILSTHAIPRVDPFSSVMRGQPWYAWEWFYDGIVGVLHGVAGLNGVVLFSATVIALTFALVYRKMIESGAQLPVAVVMLLLVFAASSIHFLARPHVLSWLFVVMWFGFLERFEADGNWRRLAWLPALMVLWVNVHGGFLLGLALLGIYFVSALLSAWVWQGSEERDRAFGRARILAAVATASTVVTLANPFGYKLHVHICRYLSDRFLMDHIDEFLSPNFHGFPQKCFAVIVLFAVAAMAGSRKHFRLSHLLVVLFAIYSGLYASRNIPPSAILLTLIAAPQLSMAFSEAAGNRDVSELWRNRLARFDRFGSKMVDLDRGLSGHVWPALALLVLVWACAHQGYIGTNHVLDAHFDDKRFPVDAVDVLASGQSRGSVFCPDKWGGYVIYRLYPKTLVAVDDRHDLYGTAFLKRYLKIVHGEPGWDGELMAMHADWVLVPADSTMASILSGSAGWKIAYRDDVAALFAGQP
ncbi:MAG TPA: hypothetical protein VFR42_03475 [Candidatus Acidoferrum sp.]|nr:hypothetical protein [Candidatus Acidoferrum sp.]